MKNNRTLLIAAIILLLLSFAGCKAEVSYPSNSSDYLVLLYLSGDANNGDNFFPTLQQAEDALYEIRNDDGSPKSGYASVNVVALWDGPNEVNESVHSDSSTRLLVLGPGYHDFDDSTNEGHYSRYRKQDWSLSSNTVDYSSTADWLFKNGRQEANMGSRTILTEFLNWAGSRYTAEHVILLFGDHGSGPLLEEESKGLIFDDDPNGDPADDSYLTTSKIRNAIADSVFAGKIDLIIEDLCMQCSIDEAYGLQGCAKYLLASENVTMGNSLGSYRLIKDMRSNMPLLTIAEDQVSYYESKWSIYNQLFVRTFSLIDLSEAEAYKAIKENVSNLALAIKALGESTYTDIVRDIRSESADYGFVFSASSYTIVRDLGLMAEELGEKYPALKTYTDAITYNLEKVILLSFASGYNEEQDTDFKYSLTENAGFGLTIPVKRQSNLDIPYNEWTLFGKDSRWSDLIIDVN